MLGEEGVACGDRIRCMALRSAFLFPASAPLHKLRMPGRKEVPWGHGRRLTMAPLRTPD